MTISRLPESVPDAEDTFSPNMWMRSEAVTFSLFLSSSLLMGMFLAVTSACGNSLQAAFIPDLSRGKMRMILNLLNSPSVLPSMALET